MKLSKTLHVGFAILATVVVVSGSMYIWHLSVVKRFKDLLQTDTRRKDEKDMQIEILRARVDTLEDMLDELQKDIPDDLLKIYSYDSDTHKGKIGFCVWTPDGHTVTQKVKLITALLMKYKFKQGSIELKRIELQGDKRIAIVYLSETKEHPFAWKGLYFQGSSGGAQTTYILVTTYLQPHYNGAWIDGVQFWYDGKPVSSDWDHISLHGTILKK